MIIFGSRELRKGLERSTCRVIGHQIIDLDRERFTARCPRCKARLDVTYDMAYGGTIVKEAHYD